MQHVLQRLIYVVTLLLDAGWSLEARNDRGSTPLNLAAEVGHNETVKCLLLRGANIDTQTNAKNPDGLNEEFTPLHWASMRAYNDVVRTLLQFGANQEIKNGWGQTAKDVAHDDETRAVFKENKPGLCCIIS